MALVPVCAELEMSVFWRIDSVVSDDEVMIDLIKNLDRFEAYLQIMNEFQAVRFVAWLFRLS
jgi:hypothetical protein